VKNNRGVRGDTERGGGLNDGFTLAWSGKESGRKKEGRES